MAKRLGHLEVVGGWNAVLLEVSRSERAAALDYSRLASLQE